MTGNGVERTLGQLLAKVDNIEKSLERADERRAVIHKRLDGLAGEVGAVKTDVATLKADVTDTKQVTDDVKRMKTMGLGVLGVVGLGSGALGASLADLTDWLSKFLRGP